VAGALICGACGADVPVRRPRCGRCGGSTKEAPPSTPTAVRRPGQTHVAIVGGVSIVALVGVAMGRGTLSSVAQTQPPAAAASPLPRETQATPAVAPSGIPQNNVFAGADAVRVGIAAYKGGDVAAAVTQFTAAVERDPNNAQALNNLGQALVRSGRARDGIPYFDSAIGIENGVWSYHFNRAKAYGDLKDWGQAIAGYAEAARLFPDDYVTQFNLARALQAKGDVPAALQAYAKATELAPAQADFHLWYGRALDQSGKRQEAAAEYRAFLELDPNASQAEKVKARLSELGEAPLASS
jgi:Flp pilus assembly protein TadD